VTTTAVNTEVMTPMERVQANPRTGPEPNWNMISAARMVVTLASMMVLMAREKPDSIDDSTGRPARISSRIRS